MGILSNLFGKNGKNKAAEKENLENTPIEAPVEHITPTADQSERRKRSEEICAAHNVPVYQNPNALFLEPEADVKIRTQEEVLDRASAILYTALKGEGLEEEYLNEIDQEFHSLKYMSPEEIRFAKNTQPSEQDRINATWRYESLHVMLWALSYRNELTYPDDVCNVSDDIKMIHALGAEDFRKKAQLRNKQEIMDEADLTLRLHWACVSARLKNQPAPGNLNTSVVYERHYALNWLIHYLDQDWDDISTDT